MLFANALLSLVTLVGFACFFYGSWQAVCTDMARQLIFERRDRLFDIAYRGGLTFSSNEYKIIRRTLESEIRFAHELTWPALIFFIIFRPKKIPSQDFPVDRAIDAIEDLATRKEVFAIMHESFGVLIGMMILKSILVAPIAMTLCVFAACSHRLNRIIRVFVGHDNFVMKNISDAILSSVEHAEAA